MQGHYAAATYRQVNGGHMSQGVERVEMYLLGPYRTANLSSPFEDNGVVVRKMLPM
jgi:hypothetical protein